MTDLIAKVLVDAQFYEKCLQAYNDKEMKKTVNTTQSKSDLSGDGLVYQESAEFIPNVDILPMQQKQKLPSLTTIVEKVPPLIVPVITTKNDEQHAKPTPKVIKKSSHKKATAPRKVIQKSKTPSTTTNITDVTSTSKTSPWYYIGLQD